jgi:hypothetical protein
MNRLRSFQTLVALPALLVTLGFSPLAHADVAIDANAMAPPDVCADSAKAGDSCTVAGPNSNEDGVCVKEVCPGESNANECSDFSGTYIICEPPVAPTDGGKPTKDGGTEEGGKSGDGGDMTFNSSGGGCSTSGGVGGGGSAWFFFGVGAMGILASSVSRRRKRS